MEESLVQFINRSTGLDLPLQSAFATMRLHMQAVINNMIETDFQGLIHLLYRVDVDERKLKYLLQENVGEEAAVILADLIIARLLQKMESRKQFKQDEEIPGDENERW